MPKPPSDQIAMPFPWPSLPDMTDRERAANHEAHRLARRAEVSPARRSLHEVRNDVLCRLSGPRDDDDVFYSPEAILLVDELEAALRATWQDIERGHAQRVAIEAIRGAVRAASDGQLI